jgi:hypothetical protein
MSAPTYDIGSMGLMFNELHLRTIGRLWSDFAQRDPGSNGRYADIPVTGIVPSAAVLANAAVIPVRELLSSSYRGVITYPSKGGDCPDHRLKAFRPK